MSKQSVGKFILKEELQHHSYNWPSSLIFHPVQLQIAPDEIQKLCLKNQQGEEVPFQLTNIQKDKGFMDAETAVFTDMPCGAEKEFAFYVENQTDIRNRLRYKETEETITFGTEKFSLKIPKKISNDLYKNRIFQMETPEKNVKGNVNLFSCNPIKNYTVQVTEVGELFGDCWITIEFEKDCVYELKIRVVEGQDFIEVKEKMKGFGKQDQQILTVEWEDFFPEYRYCQYRNWEKIDAYLQEKGYLPFYVSPYDSWVSWWNSKTTAFRDTTKGISVGTFVKDVDQWNDGTYGLWRSSSTLALKFRWDESENLIWEYPIFNGTRSTGIGIFSTEKESNINLLPKSDGLYEQTQTSLKTKFASAYIHQLWFWNEFIRFDKVKNWVLRWEKKISEYPRFFPEDSLPEIGTTVWHYGKFQKPFTPEFMEEMVYKLSHAMNHLMTSGAVSTREFAQWVYVFDMSAPKMTQKQFDDIKACCAFISYAYMDENFMPTKNLLAGHPNFLVDGRSPAAKMAALFPHHPHAKRWVEQFERAMALNLKYHVRPDVEAWNSKGGRWTENLGCYNFAALAPMMKTQALLKKAFGENVLLYPNLVKWAEYMLNSLSAPVDGVRTFPPLGAHSGAIWDPITPPYVMNLLSDALFRYEPMLAEYWQYLSDPKMRWIAERNPGEDMYRYLSGKEYGNQTGTKPPLQSTKFTGYGYTLRANVGEDNEVSVHLCQIDEGPNYRWGRAGQGGCGMIHYYAQGKRYSFNRPEDVGDENMGDVQACCNFAVLDGHEFKSVGRNDLTEPLYDFGFAQFAQVNGGAYAEPFYRSRSVLLSGNDYIIIYDEVGDMKVYGRFAWFIKEGESFPSIVQLKPGAKAVLSDGGVPIDGGGKPQHGKIHGQIYDGMGDFLTLVSHRSVNTDYNMYSHTTEYGAKIELQGRTDYIFRDSSKITYTGEGCTFTGTAGIVRLYGETTAEVALFQGTCIGALGINASLSSKNRCRYPRAGISFTVKNNRVYGKIQCEEPIEVTLSLPKASKEHKLYINGIKQKQQADGSAIQFVVEEGSTTWECTDLKPVPQTTQIMKTIVASNSAQLFWNESNGAEEYEIDLRTDCGVEWERTAIMKKGCAYTLTQLNNNTKYYVRIKAINHDCSSSWSREYPLYITDQAPYAPEGLRVWNHKEGFEVLWGKQLGVDRYILYRRAQGTMEFEAIYEGERTTYVDRNISADCIYEYVVSAVNGNGESKKSNLRDTKADGLAFWDPEPDVKFRRYTPSHEYGYRGFNPWKSYGQKELEAYPD